MQNNFTLNKKGFFLLLAEHAFGQDVVRHYNLLQALTMDILSESMLCQNSVQLTAMSLHRNSTVVSTSSKPTSKHTTQAPLVTSVLPDEDSNDINKQYPTNLLALIVLLIVIAVIIAAVLLIRRKMRMDRLRSRLRPVYRFRASEEELLFERNDFMPKQTYYTFENNKDFYKRSYSYC